MFYRLGVLLIFVYEKIMSGAYLNNENRKIISHIIQKNLFDKNSIHLDIIFKNILNFLTIFNNTNLFLNLLFSPLIIPPLVPMSCAKFRHL